MAEATRRLPDAELERLLVDLGRHIDVPATPPLAPSVRERLMARPAPQPRLWRAWQALFPPRRALSVAALVVLVLVSATLAVSPEVRAAVAERLGLRGVSVTHLPFLPAAPTTSPATPPASLGRRLGLGEPVTLAAARAGVAYGVVLPTLPELGQPDEVYVSLAPPGGQVALLYRARPGLPAANETGVGLLLTQFRGDLQLDPGLVGKGLGPDSRLERITVNGRSGFWIEGQPHLFFYRDASGRTRDETVRLAGNTLLWEQGELTLRLESALAKDAALRIATSVR